MTDDNELIGLTDRQKMIVQFDAAILGESQVELHEHRRPGAIAALHDWAEPRQLKVESHDLRKCGGTEIWHEVVLSPTHTIVVRERAA